MKVLITGATSGIGHAVAVRAHSEGHELLGVGRRAEQLEMLRHDLNAKTLRADLATDEGQEAVIRWIREELPDVVVNAAGIGIFGAAADHTVEEEMQVFNLDGLAVLRLTLETVKTWRETGKKGTILNVASVGGFVPTPMMANYCAVKAYVNRLSQGLDGELADQGIRVLVSAPGLVQSKFHAKAAKGEYDYSKKRGSPIMTAEYAADRIWKQIASGKQVDVFNWQNNLLVTLARFMPRKARLALAERAMNKIMAK